MSKQNKPRISKENFIDFLSSASPQELNDLIISQGKPPKSYTPIFFYKKPEDKKQKQEEKSNGKG